MIFKSKTKVLFATESIALADIVLNLFIFFFVTFSFFATFKKQQQESSVELALPRVRAGAIAPQQAPVTVAITAEGAIFVQDKPIDLKNLADAVKTAIAPIEQKAVIVRADKSLELEKFIHIIESIKEADIEKISIRTETVLPPKQ
jgi:biopolymer transport protein ExbD